MQLSKGYYASSSHSYVKSSDVACQRHRFSCDEPVAALEMRMCPGISGTERRV